MSHCCITVTSTQRKGYHYCVYICGVCFKSFRASYQELLVSLLWNTPNEQQQFGTLWCFFYEILRSHREQPDSKTTFYITFRLMAGQRSAGSVTCCWIRRSNFDPQQRTESQLQASTLWSFLLRTVWFSQGCLLSLIHLLSVFFALPRAIYFPLKFNNRVRLIFFFLKTAHVACRDHKYRHTPIYVVCVLELMMCCFVFFRRGPGS